MKGSRSNKNRNTKKIMKGERSRRKKENHATKFKRYNFGPTMLVRK
jgi:hypothetical protein